MLSVLERSSQHKLLAHRKLIERDEMSGMVRLEGASVLGFSQSGFSQGGFSFANPLGVA